MGPDTKIVIEQDGELILKAFPEGGAIRYPKITAGCGELWQGIEVWGNSTVGQSSGQGILDLYGATIEHMEYGIRAFKPGYGEGGGEPVPGFTGGIVIANGSNFINNKTSVTFAPYVEEPSVSTFNSCDFKHDQLLLDGSFADYAVRINGITGVTFDGCRFENSGPCVLQSSGIYAYNSDFVFNGGNSDPLNPNPGDENFFSLNYGIYAYGNGYNPDYSIDIIDSWFSGNRRGIYMSGLQVKKSGTMPSGSQKSPMTPAMEYTSIIPISGIWLPKMFFEVSISPANMAMLGYILTGAGVIPKRFIKMISTILNMPQLHTEITGTTKEEVWFTGVTEFTVNKNDITILSEGLPEGGGGVPISQMGIAYYQGTQNYPAGNWFTDQYYPPLNLNYNNSTDNNLRYYYHLNATQPAYLRLYPEEVNSSIKVYRSSGYYIWTDTCCTSKPLDIGGRDGIISERESLIEDMDSLSSELTLLIDGGNTSSLNTTIISSIPPQALQLYDELMLKSPNLSDSAMNSSILKETVLNNALLKDILVANPQSAKRDSLMDKLDQRLVPMPETMKAEIMEGIHFLSAKENLEATIQEKRMQERDLFNRLIYSYCHDSLIASPIDSLNTLLTNDVSLSSKYQLAFLNLKSGNNTTVISILSGIPGSFTLSGSDQVVHQSYINLFNTMIQIDSGNLYPWNINSTQALALDYLSDNDTIVPGAFARNTLIAAGLLEYNEVVVLPEDSLKSAIAKDVNKEENLLDRERKGWIKVYPNPAQNYFITEYQVQRIDPSINNIEIEIYSNQGTNIDRISIQKMYDQIVWRCDSYVTGLYFCILRVNGEKESATKFLITH